MKWLKYFEGKNKFPDIKKVEFEGYLVQVGRDAKSNDYLTFNIAEDGDIWMHVKGVPGSHVVIRVRENLPTPSVLKFAAELAKKNSKAAKDGSAKVVWCKRKFVKKEPGMNDGQVRVDYKNSEEIDI
jgi:predicted ribosome quality control (RQC) complex YloA/Tae2 family protein